MSGISHAQEISSSILLNLAGACSLPYHEAFKLKHVQVVHVPLPTAMESWTYGHNWNRVGHTVKMCGAPSRILYLGTT